MTDFFQHLEALFQGNELGPLLWSAYRPCRRLILFDDFCQEVLLRAVQHQASFRGQSREELLAWLRAIGQQLMLGQLRRSRQLLAAPLPDNLAAGNEEGVIEDVAAAEDRREKSRWLAAVLANLQPEERDLLIRHYYQQESLKHIATTLGIQPNTIAQRHLRLLKRMKHLRKF